MKIWKSFLPALSDLSSMSGLASAACFVCGDNDPQWTSVYLRSESGIWTQLSWDYFDIEFKFETYGISVEVIDRAPTKLIQVGEVSGCPELEFLARTEWKRPAIEGEVPADFHPVVEDSGRIEAVPANAVAAGTSLYSIVFSSAEGGAELMLGIDDLANYSLRSTSDPAVIALARHRCDLFDVSGVISWVPPDITHS